MSAIIAVNIGNEPRTPQIDTSVVRNTIAATIIAAASANFHAISFGFLVFFSIFLCKTIFIIL